MVASYAEAFDIRQASNVEVRPTATYIRYFAELGKAAMDTAFSLSRHESTVPAFMVAATPPTANFLASAIGDIVEVVHNHAPTNNLRSASTKGGSRPNFTMVWCEDSPIHIMLADLNSFWWRLTTEDQAGLRNGAHPIISGDPGKPNINYPRYADPIPIIETVLLVPAVRLNLTLEAGSALIIDNERALYALPDGLAQPNGYIAHIQ